MNYGLLTVCVAAALSAAIISSSAAEAADSSRTPGTAFEGAIAAPKLEAGANKKGGLAAVNSDGSLVSGVNVKKATNSKKGEFQVKFKQSVRGCYFFGSPTNPNPGQSTSAAIIVTPVPDPSNKKTVIVYTYSTNSKGFVNNGFYLKVDCS
jgi:hypothetical protein